MDYNRIIIELLDRIKCLEERVSTLENCVREKQSDESRVSEKPNFGGQKYRALTSYLRNSGKEQVRLSFEEIENIIGFKLSPSAYNNRANWANSTSQSLAYGWLKANYRAVEVDMVKRYVVFEKQN